VPEIKAPEPPSFAYMEWEGKRDFSAVVFTTSLDKKRNEPVTREFPIAVAGNTMRMEMDLSQMGKAETQTPLSNMIIIEHRDTKTGYTIYPNAQRYMVRKENEGADERPTVEKTKLGTEMIGKYRTDKYKVRILYKDGRIDEGLVWNARELKGMTIKSEVENNDYRVTSELRNIVLKTPPPDLFEIPEGYTEAQNFMDIMSSSPKNK